LLKDFILGFNIDKIFLWTGVDCWSLFLVLVDLINLKLLRYEWLSFDFWIYRIDILKYKIRSYKSI
jgi:hypothetical protein